jgi:uncharacterized protein YndB with AHSA1/START domain
MTQNANPTSEPTTHKLVVARDFEAPRELVWRAWTDPAQIKHWLGFGEDMTVESVIADLQVDGRFRIQLKNKEDGEFFTAVGTYLEVKPIERLVYSWDWEKDGAGTEFGEVEGYDTQVTVEFHPNGKLTRLVLTHEKFVSPQRRDNHEKGWQTWLGRLAKFVESKQGGTAA